MCELYFRGCCLDQVAECDVSKYDMMEIRHTLTAETKRVAEDIERCPPGKTYSDLIVNDNSSDICKPFCDQHCPEACSKTTYDVRTGSMEKFGEDPDINTEIELEVS